MYNALKLVRINREKKLSKAREEKRLKLERKLNKLKAELEKETIRLQTSAEFLRQVPTSSSSARGIGFSAYDPYTIKVPCLSTIEGSPNPEKDDDDDDNDEEEDQLERIRIISSVSMDNLHLPVTPNPPVGNSTGSIYGSESASQINLNSPVFYPKSMSLQGEDRTRSCSISVTSDRRISVVSFIGPRTENGQGEAEEGKTTLVTSPTKYNGGGESSYLSRNARLTSNMVGTFLIFTGLITVVLGFIATEDFSYFPPFIMAIGFLLMIGGFIIIFIGNNRLSMIAPKKKYNSKSTVTTPTTDNDEESKNDKSVPATESAPAGGTSGDKY